MRIDIVSDTVCPWCFVGRKRLERALATRPDVQVEITWRPFQLNPEMPPEGADRDAHLAAKFGGRERLDKAHAMLTDVGRQEGIDFHFERIGRTPNTLPSHALLRWALESGVQEKVSEELFRRYFVQGEDIGDFTVLREVAEAAGMDGAEVSARLERGQDFEAVAAEDERARSMGINGVPCFIFEGKYALSGAQDPSVFHQVFDMVLKEEAGEGEPS
jgi:predicted DsbA family dithiol-disulfide isomerase